MEQQHIIEAFSFELSKVGRSGIRDRVVDQLTHIDISLASGVAEHLGMTLSDEQMQTAPPEDINGLKKDASLSLYAVPSGNIKGRKVALLVSDGVNAADTLAIFLALKQHGVHAKLLAAHMGQVTASDGSSLPVDGTFSALPSLTFDAVIVPDGNIDALLLRGDACYFLLEAYKHLKVIGLSGDARRFAAQFGLADDEQEEGIIIESKAEGKFMNEFVAAMAVHRIWSRSQKALSVPA